MKPVVSAEQKSNVLVQISQTTHETTVGSLDRMIYYTLNGQVQAVEAYQNGTYSPPRPY